MTILESIGALFAALGLANLLAAIVSIVVSRPFGQRTPIALAVSGNANRTPFVSVHVATHDEPPAMVIATIEALLQSDYPHFEIIVIDNNTVDTATWQPVADRANRLGPQVRFYHCDGVVGAKAGALNIALDLADPRSRFIAVVDADYLVAPDFLARGVAACGPDVQFVQFPQVYRDADGASAVVAELSDYFEIFPRAANRAQAALLTGTLSIIAVDSLRSAGGWPTGSITEDAELGAKLWSNGARGLFVNSNVGNGLLPIDLNGLRLQRQRWVRGNVQTLIGVLKNVSLTRKGTMAVIAQLSAWIGFMAIPMISLIAVALVRAFATDRTEWPVWQWVEMISVLTIIAMLTSYLVRALKRQQWQSMAITMSLLWTASFAWGSALGRKPLRFHRTPKIAAGGRHGVSIDSWCSIIAAVTALILAIEGAVMTSIVLGLTASGLFTSPFVDRWLRTAAAGRGQSCVA